MKKVKRILRILLWVLVGIAILFLLLHTPPARNMIKSVLSRTVAGRAGGTLDIGRITYRLWRGEVTLEDVEFDYPGLRAEAHRLEASLFSRGGMSIEVDNPRFFLREEPRMSQPVRRSSPPPWKVLQYIGAVSVDKGRFEWGSASTRGEIEGSLRLARSGTEGRSREHNWLLTGDVQGSVGDNSPIPMKIAANFGLQSEDLRLEEIRIDAYASVLSARGALSQQDFITGTFRGGFRSAWWRGNNP